ncbi:MAG: c-type cytochrome [Ignavibacteriales bacterium]|nr:c-type cytochrome [Ignavibacteriales bacterium]
MEFLEKLVVVQSADNLSFLIYILITSFILLIPYAGLVNAASLLSYIFNKLGNKKNNELYLRFSRDLITIAAYKKGFMFTLGIVPLLSIGFSYTQLFHQIDSPVITYLFLSIILFIAGIFLLFLYKYSFRLDNLLKETGVKESSNSSEVNSFIKRNFNLINKTALWGIILFYVSTFILMGCIEFSITTIFYHSNVGFFSTLFSVPSLTKYLSFLTLAVSILSITVLFYFNRIIDITDVVSNEYKSFVNKFALTIGIISVIVLPVFIIANILVIPYFALTGTSYSITAIILLLLFLVTHYFYAMIKESNLKYITHVFSLVIIVSVLFVINDQASFGTSSKKQILVLSQEYDKMMVAIKEKSGTAPAINGQEIFEGRCSACHRFDRKLVGPAYKDVLPKYEGKQGELVSFIMNPVKMNPNFPPMPNQSLKQKEAEAIADYIMKTYKTK